MIRLFIDICKCFHKIKNKNELEIFNSLTEQALDEYKCKHCGAPAESMHKDGSYDRDFITYDNSEVHFHKIEIRCVRCSCTHAHAILPSVIVPYSSFSLGFLLAVIYAKLTNRFKTIEELCSHFFISQSTFYRIYKRFLCDAPEMIAAMDEYMSFLDVCTKERELLYKCAHMFFIRCGYSFMQPRIRLHPAIHLSNPPDYVSRYIGNGME